MSNLFESHGRIRVYSIGQIFVSEVEGPWNVELTRQWVRAMGPTILEIGKKGPVAGIAVFTTSMLCTPESLELSGRASRETSKMIEIVAMAHVAAATVEGRTLMQHHFDLMVRDLYPIQLFEDFGLARNWVEGMLAQARGSTLD